LKYFTTWNQAKLGLELLLEPRRGYLLHRVVLEPVLHADHAELLLHVLDETRERIGLLENDGRPDKIQERGCLRSWLGRIVCVDLVLCTRALLRVFK
jgi:hypothetical protein